GRAAGGRTPVVRVREGLRVGPTRRGRHRARRRAPRPRGPKARAASWMTRARSALRGRAHALCAHGAQRFVERYGTPFMPYTVENLLEVLELERLEHDIYRGRNRDIGTGRVFGGQVLAQALIAARNTVETDREAHSLHGYFILPGDLDAPIVYFVDRLRDGKSFTTRRVTAIQHGRAIFNMSASFHRVETGLEHQTKMPDVPDPESLKPELNLIREMADRIPDRIRAVFT